MSVPVFVGIVLGKSMPHFAWFGPGNLIGATTDTHTEKLVVGGLCSSWKRTPTMQTKNSAPLLYTLQGEGVLAGVHGFSVREPSQVAITLEEEAVVASFCIYHSVLCILLSWTRERLCHAFGPYPKKVLLFPWDWGNKVLDMAMRMPTIPMFTQDLIYFPQKWTLKSHRLKWDTCILNRYP